LGGLVLATNRYQLFDQLPAAQTVGRDASFETVNTAIVVLDDQFRVTDLNIAAEALFGLTDAETIGKPLGTLLPDTVDQVQLTEPGEHTFELVDTGTVIEAETTVTTDYRDRDFGRVIVFKNITKERRRQQRIQVLNRVLRHNLRNNLVVANGRLDVLGNGDPSQERHITKVRESLDNIVEMGSKAGTIEEMLQADRTTTTPRPLSETIEMAVAELADTYDTSVIDVEVARDIHTTVNPVILETILFELLENAIEHTAGATIVVEVPADGSRIVVRDTGPGIPEDEREVFVKGEETPLQHGSGLGLWLVKWGVGRIGGQLSFAIDDDGTEITIHLPETLHAEEMPAER
jgi:PAS domain S-box-containing protein